MSYRTKSRDWKQKVKDICPCFVTELANPVPSKGICPNPCNLEEFKIIMLQHKTPDRSSIIRAMIKSGEFTKREIIYALVEIHDSIYRSGERRVEENIAELKKEGYRIWTDDKKYLKAAKE